MNPVDLGQGLDERAEVDELTATLDEVFAG
jgi:hypothetical protein